MNAKNKKKMPMLKLKRQAEMRFKKNKDGFLDIEDAWDTLIETGEYPIFQELVRAKRAGHGAKEWFSYLPDDILFSYADDETEDKMNEDIIMTMMTHRGLLTGDFHKPFHFKVMFRFLEHLRGYFAFEQFARSKVAIIKWPTDNKWSLDIELKLNGTATYNPEEKVYKIEAKEVPDFDYIKKYTSHYGRSIIDILVRQAAGEEVKESDYDFKEDKKES